LRARERATQEIIEEIIEELIEEEEREGIYSCPVCGRRIERGDNFCPRCGTKFKWV
jgi:rubrerythrin